MEAAPLYPPAKKVKSDVWTHFGFLTKENQDVNHPTCRTCRKKVSAPSANTTNMKAHLRDRHPSIFAGLKATATPQPKTTPLTLEQTLEKKNFYGPQSKQARELNRAVAYLIAKEGLPYNIVDHPGFQHLMSKAAPQYKMPSRQFFSRNEIPTMYSALRASVTDSVAQGTFYAATTDLWTSNGGGGEPYMSFTLHFIDQEWKLKSHCLETLMFPEDHTAENILEMTENILEEWGIKKEALVGITTDNASNMQKAFKEFPELWLSCFGHNLNLAIAKVLKISRIEKAVRACRHLVQGFSRSWKRRRELKNKQAALELPQKALIHDVVTRWGSTYQMVVRFISQQQAISATLAGERAMWHLMPKDADITVLEQLCGVLGPLSEFTDALASEKRVTLSAVKPVLEHIMTELAHSDEDPSLVTEIKSVIKVDLDSRYNEKAKRTMDLACFVDPRFKTNFSDDPEATQTNCIQEALKLAPVRVRQEEADEPCPSKRPATSTTTTYKGLAGLLKKITASKQQSLEDEHRTTEEQVRAEIKRYTSLPSIAADMDPLLWWCAHGEEFPHLSRLACRLLCIPATSVPSERVFSGSGHILTPLRAQLKAENVNMLTFLMFNLP